MVTIWSLKPFKALFAAGGPLASTIINIPVPMLHKLVREDAARRRRRHALWRGLHLQLAAGHRHRHPDRRHHHHCLHAPVARQGRGHAGRDLQGAARPIYSIGMVLAFAFVANYSGLSATLALALAHTGHAFTFFSPFLGWLGVFLTGSDTSANALLARCRPPPRSSWACPGAHRGGQHHRRRDRQDDLARSPSPLPARPWAWRQGVGPVPLHRQAQPDLRRHHRHHHTLQAYVFPWMIPGH
jgi:hypothetical protein